MTYENYIKAQLVRFSIEEAYHTGSHEPVLAVAQVIANRVNEGWCGGDWMKVIEIAPECRGTIQPCPTQVIYRETLFRRILQGIDDVYHGLADDSNVNNDQGQKALYYAELHYLNRDWFKENILGNQIVHPRIAKVGQIDFFA